ncbi:MAG: hypothetical protein CVU33_02975 [Betaproteobacteria bacterium HGW-Betaproteobacteria-6]|jgi:hypothetical protein|nr:MAG: hypothetical protein CVU33_02975 [Betaproteobacteria bacterium HGW-Betaproteobacteria-6]
MNMKKLSVVALFLAFNAHADLYKCPSASGTSYQEKPCAGGGQKINIEAPPDGSPRAEVAQAISLQRVLIGMTEAEVIRSWGRPDKVNRTRGAGYVSEQWVYERGGISSSQYLYFDNGILKSLQTPAEK